MDFVLIPLKYMKQTISLIFIYCSFLVNGQHWQWAHDFGPTSGGKVITDPFQNIYTLSSQGLLHINKYDPNGTLIWSSYMNNCSGNSISLDKTGNVYLTGSCLNTTLCGTSSTLTSYNGVQSKAFLGKLDNNGNAIWLKTWGAPDTAFTALDVSTDLFGNSYVISQGFSQNFSKSSIIKYDSQGNFLWCKNYFNVHPSAVEVDVNGNAYVTGVFQYTVSFDGIILTPNSWFNFFVAKYDKNGNVKWAITDGSNSDEGEDLTLDGKGNIYVTGSSQSNSNFNGTIHQMGGFFVAKYDTSGIFQWVRQAKKNCRGLSLDCDTVGDCIVSGDFFNNMIFQNPSNTTLTGTRPSEMFVAKYAANGNLIWSIFPGGPFSGGAGIFGNLTCDKLGNTYISGGYKGTFIFGNTTLNNPTESYHTFLVKLKDSSNSVVTSSQIHSSAFNGFNIFPNPSDDIITIHFKDDSESDAELVIRNVTGQLLLSRQFKNVSEFSETIKLGDFPRGVYFVELVSDRRREVRKVILE
jgi:hypothetical protein